MVEVGPEVRPHHFVVTMLRIFPTKRVPIAFKKYVHNMRLYYEDEQNRFSDRQPGLPIVTIFL